MDDEFDGIIETTEYLSPTQKRRTVETWQRLFLERLAETSNVTLAQQRVLISKSHIYKTRRNDPEFAIAWLKALSEGYDNLEMELLCRLRTGESRDPGSVRHDNVAAIRLLAQHRANAERGRALRDNDDEQATLDSIDALFRDMRERRAANAAILLTDQSEDTNAGD